METKLYRLYALFPEEKRYQAINWRECRPVKNLIYATLFNEVHAKQALDEATRLNPCVKFKLHAISC